MLGDTTMMDVADASTGDTASASGPAPPPAVTPPTTPAAPFKTSDYLTKFEFTRVLGLRILQLTERRGLTEDPQKLARREILEGLNEAVVRRRLPDGSHEDRQVKLLRLPTDVRRMCAEGA